MTISLLLNRQKLSPTQRAGVRSLVYAKALRSATKFLDSHFSGTTACSGHPAIHVHRTRPCFGTNHGAASNPDMGSILPILSFPGVFNTGSSGASGSQQRAILAEGIDSSVHEKLDTPIENYQAMGQLRADIFGPGVSVLMPNTGRYGSHPLGEVFESRQRAQSIRNVKRAAAGNFVVTLYKGVGFAASGSSGLFAETVHGVIDTLNQVFLLWGLQKAGKPPDRDHPLGYGRAVWAWSLMSSVGFFFAGCGVTITHALQKLTEIQEVVVQTNSWISWSSLGVSFAVDLWVLLATLTAVSATRPNGVSLLTHIKKQRDPMTMTLLLEDGAAVAGVGVVSAGLLASSMTGDPIWDVFSELAVGTMLGIVAIRLIRMNTKFLMGLSVDKEMEDSLVKLVATRPAVEHVRGLQTQWISPTGFSVKAEVTLRGSYLSRKLWESYGSRITAGNEGTKEVLSEYSEQVTQLIEKEIFKIERAMRIAYPAIAFIEIEPVTRSPMHSSRTYPALSVLPNARQSRGSRRGQFGLKNKYRKPAASLRPARTAGIARIANTNSTRKRVHPSTAMPSWQPSQR